MQFDWISCSDVMYVNIFLLEQKGKKETTSVIHSWYLAVPATVKYHLAISLYLILLATFQFYINVIQIPKYKIKQKRFMYFHKLNTLCTNWSNLKHLQTAVVSHIRIFLFFFRSTFKPVDGSHCFYNS